MHPAAAFKKMSMPSKFVIKKKLYEVCQFQIDKRINNITYRLRSLEEARNQETKSSAGDKHETARTLMQLELEKSEIQLYNANNIKRILLTINPEKPTCRVGLGSLVNTSQGYYFMAIGLGKVALDGVTYFCISKESPIGNLLLHKEQGAEFHFNGNNIVILEIS
jgi:hypothetical protein